MFNYEEITSRCQALAPVQVASLSRSLLRYDETPLQDTALSVGEALLIWLADLLEWMQVCNQDQRTLLLQELRGEILKLGEAIEEHFPKGEVPVFHIGFADRRWATCSTMKHFFDLDEGVWVKELDEPPLETITYAVAALFMRNHRAIQSQGRQDNAKNSTDKQP
jgi:hypothetical protein